MFLAELLERIRANGIAKIEGLDLDELNLGNIKIIFQALQTNISVTILNLSDLKLKLDMSCWQELFAMLGANNSITMLDLRNTGLTSEQLELLVNILLEHNLNLTTCLVDENIASTELGKRLARVLERNQKKEWLEDVYRSANNRVNLSSAQQIVPLNFAIQQLCYLVQQMEQRYRDNNKELAFLNRYNYPSPGKLTVLRDHSYQEAVRLCGLWINILNTEENNSVLIRYYNYAECLRKEFIPNDQKILVELNNIYIKRLLQLAEVEQQNLMQNFRCVLMILNGVPQELITEENIALFSKCCALYYDLCATSIDNAKTVYEAIEFYYYMLNLLNNSAILLCYGERKVQLSRNDIYAKLGRFILQYGRVSNYNPIICSQLLQLLHAIRRDDHQIEGIREVLLLLTREYIINLLQSLYQSDSVWYWFSKLTKSEIEECIIEMRRNFPRFMQIAHRFCMKQDDLAKTYPHIREILSIIQTVESYMLNIEEYEARAADASKVVATFSSLTFLPAIHSTGASSIVVGGCSAAASSNKVGMFSSKHAEKRLANDDWCCIELCGMGDMDSSEDDNGPALCCTRM